MLPLSCRTCTAYSAPDIQHSDTSLDGPMFEASLLGQRPNSRSLTGSGDGERCASCRLSLPTDSLVRPSGSSEGSPKFPPSPPLRTKEHVHVCGTGSFEFPEKARDLSPGSPASPPLLGVANAGGSCHTHQLQYVSTGSPVESEPFSRLRRATIRTLSGEQLPRGQSSGPLLFGDPRAGYTIAYVFRLADTHARGRQRYYALLALAGSDTYRAFEASTMVWAYFEKIALNIIRAAQEAASRAVRSSSPSSLGQLTPISSFLTGRGTDPDGFPRNVTNIRANGITELVDNTGFFSEVHLAFVGILRCLGRSLGGAHTKDDVAPALAELARRRPFSATDTQARDSEEAWTYGVPQRCSAQAPSKLPSDEPASGAQRDPGIPSTFQQCPIHDLVLPAYQRDEVLA